MKHLIIGFSAAGATAAEQLRRGDPDAEITVLNGEGVPFYLRLDLEGLFQGKPREQLMPRPPEFWEEKRIAVLPEKAVRVNPARQEVETAGGTKHSYDRLLIAAGASPQRLKLPGRELEGIYQYHTLTDAERILAQRDNVKRAVIIGGGILGLELAHVAVGFGWHVTVLVRGGYVGSPMVDESGSHLVRASLEKAGVELIFYDEAAAFAGTNGHVEELHTKQGRILDTDFVAICIGVRPELGFLADSGLLTAGQLVVDEQLRAPAEHVYAAGDAALVRTQAGELIANFTWASATSQARTAAANMLGAESLWRDEVLYNLDLLFDQPFTMIGNWQKRHESGRVLHELHGDGLYRAVVTQEGRIDSAFLLGSREHDRRVRKLVTSRANVEGKVERIFAADARPEEFG